MMINQTKKLSHSAIYSRNDARVSQTVALYVFQVSIACCIITGLILQTGCNQSNTPNQDQESAESQNLVVPNNSTDGNDAEKTHFVRVAVDSKGMQVDELSKKEIDFYEWMEPRKKKQIDGSKNWPIFHDFQYIDRQPESGINFRHYPVDCATREYKSAHYDHGNGVAVADIDNDGLLDLYLLSQIGTNGLYRNTGNGKFEDITPGSKTGLDDRVSVSASFADIDNDGDADLFVTSVREGNKLFENDGTGQFTDITDKAGLGYQGHSSGALFFDFDRDGLLDLFLSNVGQYTLDEKTGTTTINSVEYPYHVAFEDAFSGHLKPERAEKSILYKNMGGNVFEDVSKKVGLEDKSWSGAATSIDGNGDLWPDLYVTNMQGNDEYYENVDGIMFLRKSRDVFPKTPFGSMGIKVFDFENDGRPDVYVTDMHSDMSENVPPEKEKLKSNMRYPDSFLQTAGASIYGNALYRKKEDGTFAEVSDQVNAENYWPWGLSIGDLNADGFEDAFVASSMNYPFRYGVNSLLLNDRGKQFLDSEFVVGVEPRRDGRTTGFCFKIPADTREFLGSSKVYLDQICEGRDGDIEVWSALGTRSSVMFDLENDGDLDIVTNEFNAEPMVLVSDLSERKPLHFLRVQLIGTTSNRDGLGAKVVLHTASTSQTRFHDGQSGYLSQSRAPLYFGLGEDATVNKIEVLWPSGNRQVIEGPIDTNQTITITEES